MTDINERVAREVMGWSKFIGPVTDIAVWCGSDGGCEHTVENFAPRDNISDAWLVVERMREKGWHLAIESPMTEDDNWLVTIWTNPQNPSVASIYAETAPLAICLAALEAVKEG